VSAAVVGAEVAEAGVRAGVVMGAEVVAEEAGAARAEVVAAAAAGARAEVVAGAAVVAGAEVVEAAGEEAAGPQAGKEAAAAEAGEEAEGLGEAATTTPSCCRRRT
jgi:hypothetical protein